MQNELVRSKLSEVTARTRQTHREIERQTDRHTATERIIAVG